MDDIVRKTDDDALVTRTVSNSGEWVPLFGDWRDEVLLDSVAMALVEWRKGLQKEYRDELTAAIHKLRASGRRAAGRVEGYA
jgi:hypothetical protein